MNRFTVSGSDGSNEEIEKIYLSAYKNLHAPEQLYRKVMDMDQDKEKNQRITRRLPKVASIAIVMALVLALGGGAAWAMISSPLKDHFFKNSDKEFTQIYNIDGWEYTFGTHKLIYEGSVYDNSTGEGMLHFTIWDKDGNPVDIKTESKRESEGTSPFAGMVINCDVPILRFIETEILVDLGNDRCNILMTYLQNYSKEEDGNNLYIRFKRLKKNGEDFFAEKDFRFVLLNGDDEEKIKKDIESLDMQKINSSVTGKDDIMLMLSENGTMQPEIVDILKKYNVCTAAGINVQPQVIIVKDIRLTVGRTSMTIEYNDDCKTDIFSFVRGDGTKYNLQLFNVVGYDTDGNMIETDRKERKWDIEGEEMQQIFIYGGGVYGKQNVEYGNTQYINFGFILGEDEEVTIEADGQIYE